MLVAVLRGRWPLVVMPIAIATVVVLLGAFSSSTTYEASSTVRVTSRSSLLGATVRPDDLAYLDRLFNTYERLATSKQMLTRLAARVDGVLDAKVRARPSTELLDVTVKADDEKTAVTGANVLASLLIERVEELSEDDVASVDTAFEQRMRPQEKQLTTLRRQRAQLAATGAREAVATVDTQIRLLSSSIIALRTSFEENRLAREAQGRTVSLVERATRNSVQTVSNGLAVNLVLAVLLGGLVGVGLALLAERLHPAPHTVEEIGSALEVPVIGVFPTFDGDGSSQLLEPGIVASVKRLAAIAAARVLHEGVRTVAVVSPERGEGRTTVAAGLAVGLAESGRKVLLVDADFRAPAVHETFGVANGFGLSGLLTTPKSTLPRATVKTFIQNLELVPAGTAPVRTVDISGQRLRRVLKEATTAYDVVLIDTAALLGDVDALQLASSVDGVLLVAGGRSARWSTLERAAGQLQKIGARLLGVVGNRWVDQTWQEQYAEDPSEFPTLDTTLPSPVTIARKSNGKAPGSRPARTRTQNAEPTASTAVATEPEPPSRTRPRTLGSD